MTHHVPCPAAPLCTASCPCAECARLLPLGTDHEWDMRCPCEACCREWQWRLRHVPIAAWTEEAAVPAPAVMRALLVHELGTVDLAHVATPILAAAAPYMQRGALVCECVDWTIPAAAAETEWAAHDEAACEASECTACGRLMCPAGALQHYHRNGCPACGHDVPGH
jgi:hypothetical protein